MATAWSGYQAAQWAGKRAEQYAQASRLRVTAEGLATLAGQERIYDSGTFNSWLAANLDGKEKEGEFLERRFRDEYRPAFTACMKTDPFNNAQAPPGPMFMPDYHNARHEQFLGLSKQAAEIADQRTKSGENPKAVRPKSHSVNAREPHNVSCFGTVSRKPKGESVGLRGCE